MESGYQKDELWLFEFGKAVKDDRYKYPTLATKLLRGEGGAPAFVAIGELFDQVSMVSEDQRYVQADHDDAGDPGDDVEEP